MSEPLSLPADLMRRYRRCIRFDYWLCVVYILTASIPAWMFFKGAARLFHATGAMIIICVGVAGLIVNQRVLDHRISQEKPAYWVTTIFVLSRLILAAWGTIISTESLMRQIFPESDVVTSWTEWATLLLKALVSPPLFYLFFFAAAYRTVYHISVHFYLRGIRS